MQSAFTRASRWLATIAAAASLAACASAARPDMMIAQPLTAASPGAAGYKAFKIAPVDGGAKTNPMWMSNVSGPEFQQALEASLRAAGYLADDPTQATGEIKANLDGLDRPMAGLDMSVTARVRYAATQSGHEIFNDLVAATGTARLGESLIGVERLRIANEAAVRENIQAFIKRLQDALAAPKP